MLTLNLQKPIRAVASQTSFFCCFTKLVIKANTMLPGNYWLLWKTFYGIHREAPKNLIGENLSEV